MDRSFLSQPEVIAASRSFVCIRLTTYENEEEMNFLRKLYIGRSGDVENTTFTILSPDAAETLVRPGRSTRRVFADAADMARSMAAIARRYSPAADGNATPPALPIAQDVRLGLDVAASDSQPLVVVRAADRSARKELASRVAQLAWGDEFIGRFVYAEAATAKECQAIAGVLPGDGMFVVEPDPFGQRGKAVRLVAAEEPTDRLAAALRAVLMSYSPSAKDIRTHRTQAIQQGQFWETKLPVSDRQEAAARQRTKWMIEHRK